MKSLALALSLLAPLAWAQELSIGLIERTPAGEYVTAATVSLPMATDAAAQRAATSVRLWIRNTSTIDAAVLLPRGSDGQPLAEAPVNSQ